MDFDFLGRNDSFEKYENQIIKEIIGEAEDFEVERFSHNDFLPQTNKTNLNHSFFFYQTATTQYEITYRNDFSINEIYRFANSFNNSFFKLDFYNSPSSNEQINYLTQIIPVQQGMLEDTKILNINPPQDVKIRTPKFSLDFVGDKEGFFIYWLKKRNFINVDTFYVSAKFFNGKTGKFYRFTNNQVSTTNFNQTDYFYYKYVLDYTTKTYKVFGHGSNNDVRRGYEGGQPIIWYEYLNPI
jgi:hypothetical protein